MLNVLKVQKVPRSQTQYVVLGEEGGEGVSKWAVEGLGWGTVYELKQVLFTFYIFSGVY